MALQKNISLTNNFGEQTIILNAYIKVGEVIFNKEKSFGKIFFKKTKDSDTIDIKNFEFVSIVGENAKDAIAQGYDYLKTLPEFADAVDC